MFIYHLLYILQYKKQSITLHQSINIVTRCPVLVFVTLKIIQLRAQVPQSLVSLLIRPYLNLLRLFSMTASMTAGRRLVMGRNNAQQTGKTWLLSSVGRSTLVNLVVVAQILQEITDWCLVPAYNKRRLGTSVISTLSHTKPNIATNWRDDCIAQKQLFDALQKTLLQLVLKPLQQSQWIFRLLIDSR